MKKNLTLGERIEDLMKEKGVTNVQLAEAIGTKPGNLSKIRNGENTNPKSELIKNLALYFDVSTDYILGLSDVRNVEDSYISKTLGLNAVSIARLKDIVSQECIIFPENDYVRFEDDWSSFLPDDGNKHTDVSYVRMVFSPIDYINRLLEQATLILSPSSSIKLTGINQLLRVSKKLNNIFEAHKMSIQSDDLPLLSMSTSFLSEALQEFIEIKNIVRNNCTVVDLFENERPVIDGIRQSLRAIFDTDSYNEQLEKFKKSINDKADVE